MALLFFAGFDNFGGSLVGGAGFGNDFPAKGAGITGTPHEANLPLLHGTVGQPFNSIGVPNDDRWRTGSGTERRNMLVACTGGASSGTYLAMFRMGPGLKARDMREYWKVSFGFTYCDFTPNVPAAGYYAGRMMRTGNTSYIMEHITGSDNIRFLGSATLYPMVRGVPIYIEFVFENAAPAASGTPPLSASVYINGELFVTVPSFITQTATQAFDFTWEFGMDRPLSVSRWLGFSDIYMTDHTGNAPYNGRLGPQIVQPFTINSVDPQDWTLVGGTNPVTILSDKDDATYLRSPIGKATVNVGADLQVKPGSWLNGVAMYGRINRELGAPRNMSATGKRADGVALGANIAPVVLKDAPTYFTIHQFLPKTAEEREALNFSDSGKLQYTITTEQP